MSAIFLIMCRFIFFLIPEFPYQLFFWMTEPKKAIDKDELVLIIGFLGD